MKRLLLIIVALIATSATLSAQMTLDARSMQIYDSKPKSAIVPFENGISGKVEFDETGRVTKVSIQDFYMTFTWRPDNTRITVKTYTNGENTGAEYINIIEYNDRVAHYEMGGTTVKLTYNKWNKLISTEAEQGGIKATATYIYDNEKRDSTPRFIEVSSSTGRTMSQAVLDVTLDSYGNWIETTIDANGNIMHQTREIEYY